MAEYDGSIRIKTEIDSKNASAQLMSLENRITKTADKVASLRSKMESLKDTKIPTQEYTEVQNQITETEKKLALLYERQEKFLETGGKTRSSTYQKMQYDIEQLENTLKYAKGELQNLVDTGKAFTLGSGTQEYGNLGQQLGYAENELSVLNQKHDELIEKQNSTANGYKKIGKVAKTSLEKVSKEAEKSSKSLAGMSKGFKSILKYGFGIRSLYVLFNKIRSAITEGFENLYNSSASFKNSVDGLKASATTLKNSFASAFAPIVEIAIPYIQKLMDYISQLLGIVAQFTAAITGQKTYTKAIKQTTAAMEDQTKAANKQLSPLDKLNNMTSQASSEDTGTGAMFEEVPIDTSILDFIDRLKNLLKPIVDYAKKLKDIFMQGFWDGLGDWEYRWDSIKNSLASIKDSLIDIFTDPNVLNAADEWAKSVAYMLGSLAGSVASIGLTIATNLIGGIAKYLEQNKDRIKEYLISMFNISTEINMQLAEFFQTIAYIFEAFASEQAQQLTANIIGIFMGIFMGITQLAQKFLRDIVTLITQPFIDNKEAFRQALEGFLSVLADVTGTIKQGIDDTFDHLNQVYDEHVKPFFDSVTQGISELTGQFLEFWNNNVQPMLEEWGEKFDSLWSEHIQPALNNIGDSLGQVFDSLKELWEDVLKPLISWIIENVLPVLLPIFDQLFDTSLEVFSGMIDVISDLMSIFADFVNLIVKLIKGDFSGAWESARKIVDTAISGIKRILDSAAKTISNWANTIGSIFDSVSGKGKSVSSGYSTPTPSKMAAVSTYDIPGYATGQVIPRTMKQHLAILGDNNSETEVVSPLSTIEQAVENVMSRNNAAGGEITIKIPVEIDGNVLFELVKKYSNEQFKRTGKPAFS